MALVIKKMCYDVPYYFSLKNKTFSMNHFIEWSPIQIIMSWRSVFSTAQHMHLEPNAQVPIPEGPCICSRILASNFSSLGSRVFIFSSWKHVKYLNHVVWFSGLNKTLLVMCLAGSAQELFLWKNNLLVIQSVVG